MTVQVQPIKQVLHLQHKGHVDGDAEAAHKAEMFQDTSRNRKFSRKVADNGV